MAAKQAVEHVTVNMSEKLISILCGEKIWTWDTRFSYIAFKEDGTGEVCHFHFLYFILFSFSPEKRDVAADRIDPNKVTLSSRPVGIYRRRVRMETAANRVC